jgi:putative tryptophan/tyrosine transport system substrate-binding protein
MRRIGLTVVLAVSLFAFPLVGEAQQPTMPVVGFVRSSSIEAVPHMVAAFRQGLKDTGYVEGQNVAIEFRSADDHYERLPAIIEELIRRPVAVVVANDAAARAAKAATTTIPIVFATGGDPVSENLVASFNRPGANVTGVSFLANLGAKKLELIRALVSKPRTIGVMENPNSPASQNEWIEVETAARAVDQRVVVLKVSTEQDFDAAFTTLVRQRAGALLVTGDALFAGRSDKLVALAARHRLPTMYFERTLVEAGGLMSYGTNVTDAYRQVGEYVGRILKGEKPADLPVVRPTKFELVINLKTAKALGLTIPPPLLLQADQVIE